MFILGTIVLYQQCRVELSVLRQQLLESGGKKILLRAEELGGDDAERAFELALDKTLEQMRKVPSLCARHIVLSSYSHASAPLYRHETSNRSRRQR